MSSQSFEEAFKVKQFVQVQAAEILAELAAGDISIAGRGDIRLNEDAGIFVAKSNDLARRVCEAVLMANKEGDSLVRPSSFSSAFVVLALHQFCAADPVECVRWLRMNISFLEAMNALRGQESSVMKELREDSFLSESLDLYLDACRALAQQYFTRVNLPAMLPPPAVPPPPPPSIPPPSPAASSSVPAVTTKKRKSGEKKTKAEEKKTKAEEKKKVEKKEEDENSIDTTMMKDQLKDAQMQYKEHDFDLPSNGNGLKPAQAERWTRQIPEDHAHAEVRKHHYGDRRLPACQHFAGANTQCLSADASGPAMARAPLYFAHHITHFCQTHAKSSMKDYQRRFGGVLLNGCAHCMRTKIHDGADLFVYEQKFEDGSDAIAPNTAFCYECCRLTHVRNQLKDRKMVFSEALTTANDERVNKKMEQKKIEEEKILDDAIEEIMPKKAKKDEEEEDLPKKDAFSAQLPIPVAPVQVDGIRLAGDDSVQYYSAGKWEQINADQTNIRKIAGVEKFFREFRSRVESTECDGMGEDDPELVDFSCISLVRVYPTGSHAEEDDRAYVCFEKRPSQFKGKETYRDCDLSAVPRTYRSKLLEFINQTESLSASS